jgi:hypothetical protein
MLILRFPEINLPSALLLEIVQTLYLSLFCDGLLHALEPYIVVLM